MIGSDLATSPAIIGRATPEQALEAHGFVPVQQVHLRVLGRFELHLDGRRRNVPWQVQRVLGFLAVGGAAQPRATVAGTLWGDVSQRRAQANLRNAAWRSVRSRVVDQAPDRPLEMGM